MAHRRRTTVPPGIGRLLTAIAIVLALATIAGLWILWPRGEPDVQTEELGLVQEVYDARVLARRQDPCPGAPPEQELVCPTLRVELLEGPDEGQDVNVPLPEAFARTDLSTGDVVVVGVNPGAAEDVRYSLIDRDRRGALFWLALAFAAVVVLLGRLRGLAALAGLAASLLVLTMFVLPAVLEGTSPLLVAVVGASAIAFLALYLAHGLTPMTTVALMGTVGSLVLTAVLGTLFVELAHMTGLATEEAGLVNFGAAQVDLAGLILGGVVIGALGAIDDMTVTQASAVWELREANPAMPHRRLVRSAMRIGRDHVASTVNTLVLAYAGASLPLLILFVLSEQSLVTVANSEVVATEIVRTLVGSIGLVASVPLTTWLAARARPVVEEDLPEERETAIPGL